MINSTANTDIRKIKANFSIESVRIACPFCIWPIIISVLFSSLSLFIYFIYLLSSFAGILALNFIDFHRMRVCNKFNRWFIGLPTAPHFHKCVHRTRTYVKFHLLLILQAIVQQKRKMAASSQMKTLKWKGNVVSIDSALHRHELLFTHIHRYSKSSSCIYKSIDSFLFSTRSVLFSLVLRKFPTDRFSCRYSAQLIHQHCSTPDEQECDVFFFSLLFPKKFSSLKSLNRV